MGGQPEASLIASDTSIATSWLNTTVEVVMNVHNKDVNTKCLVKEPRSLRIEYLLNLNRLQLLILNLVSR